MNPKNYFINETRGPDFKLMACVIGLVFHTVPDGKNEREMGKNGWKKCVKGEVM